jgi:glycosyltransferase involved in cell wall biosynthesis
MTISVVIPLYNKGSTVLRAIESVLSQTLKPTEIIVVDDGSTDGSGELVTRMNDPSIILIRQENAGVSAARNLGIKASKSDWIGFLDADDIWMPEFLETMESLNRKYPQCNVLASAYLFEDFRQTRRGIILKKVLFPGNDGILENYFEVAASSHPPVCSSAVVVKKEALLVLGGFPEGIASGEDLLTWTMLSLHNKIAYTLKPLAVFIQDSAHTYDNIPNRIPQIPDKVGIQLEKLVKLNKGIKAFKHYVALWFKMRASIFLRLGMRKNALLQSFKSLKYNPAEFKVYFYIILMPMPKKVVNGVFKLMGKR